MDFKQEIKLSDLVRKTRRSSRAKGTRTGGLAQRSRNRELVGIKIGASQLAAARVVNNGAAHLRQPARPPLPAGIVVRGEVRDIAALAAALDEFFTLHSLPRRSVRLGLSTNHVGVRSFEIAGIDDERQLANAVLYRAHDVVSIPVDEAVIDYRV